MLNLNKESESSILKKWDFYLQNLDFFAHKVAALETNILSLILHRRSRKFHFFKAVKYNSALSKWLQFILMQNLEFVTKSHDRYLTTERPRLSFDDLVWNAGFSLQKTEVVIQYSVVSADWLEAVVAVRTDAGLERVAADGVRRTAGGLTAGAAAADSVVTELQRQPGVTVLGQADSSVQLALTAVGLVVVAADRAVDGLAGGADALHRAQLAAAALRVGGAVQPGAHTGYVTFARMHHYQLTILLARVLK